MYECIPGELKQLPNWVCWSAVKDENGRIKKLPVNPYSGSAAQSNNPSTWSDFNTAFNASKNYSGIGFMFGDCPYFGVDIDNAAKEIEAFKNDKTLENDKYNIIAEFIYTLQSYSELSQSGNGIHIICKGKLPKQGRRRGNVEMYESGRFFVMTGNCISKYQAINDCAELIKPLHEKYIGGGKEPTVKTTSYPIQTAPQSVNEILELASKAKNSGKFTALYNGDISGYNSQSEADMALCDMLAFWCGRDANLMDCIFRQSKLMRDKWDRRQSGSTYGTVTIQKAIANCTEIYTLKEPDTYNITIGETKSAPNETRSPKFYTFDDMGNAQRFVDLFGDSVRYCYTDKKWLYYDSRKWCYDYTGSVERIADRAVEAMAAEAKIYSQIDAEKGGEMLKQFQKHYKSSRSNKTKKAMISEVMHHLPITPIQLDKNKYFLNTPCGILYLKDGRLLPHDTKYNITKITMVEYSDTIDCPLWLKFLDDVFCGDKDLIRYIQKAVGYSLTGSTSEQCAFFLYGIGNNGKSTFLEVVRDICGDYAVNIQPETIMIRNSNSSNINSDIARLKGARLVTSVEPNEGVRINEGLVKQLTGEDIVTARKLYGDEFEFKPEFKIWMATNHKPIVRGTDRGIWRRIHMIPFAASIPPEKVDKHLKEKLTREYAAILHWAVDGFLLYQKEGLEMPNAVFQAVKEYRREMDVITAFIDNCCMEDKNATIQASVLYAAYSNWCNDGNEYKMSNTKFGVEIAKRFERVKGMSSYVYRGIKLN